MKKITLVLIASVSMLAATFSFAGSIQTTANSKSPLSVSYIQTSPKATLTPVDVNAGVYVLTLQQIGPYVTYFSDRPNRIIGKLDEKTYLKEWTQGLNDGFTQDAPNAVLSGIIAKDGKTYKDVNVIMTLMKPVYSKSHASITYKVHLIDAKHLETNSPLQFTYSTLFIDSACVSCIP